MNDPIGDMLTRIRNAQMRGKSTVSTPASKLRAWVLDVLADEGLLRIVIQNIIQNSYDSIKDTGEIRIAIKRTENFKLNNKNLIQIEIKVLTQML